MGGGFERSTDVEAPVVFAGYDVTAPDLRHDDYAGIDARGKPLDGDAIYNGAVDNASGVAALIEIARAAEAGAAAAEERLVPDPFPSRTSFLSSDQASFIQRGVPALAVGATRTAKARPLVLDWMNRRYHAPGDDLNQPLDFAATARYARALFFIAQAVAQADERPRWNRGNFYGERFASFLSR